jgi:photosynthetic reaction center H subunit
MNTPLIAGHIDIAELMFYIFFLFFLGLVIYLRREDRREGYPLETDVGGRLLPNDGLLQTALPKTFHLAFGQGTVTAPNSVREPVDVPNARRTAPWAGSSIEPVGDPIGAGVGPGARAQRAKVADVTSEGHLRIVPMSAVPGVSFEGRDVNPMGLTVRGADGAVAGTVSDVWVDRSEMLIRYLEVDTGARRVLLPMTMALVSRSNNNVTCSALTAAQFGGAPSLATAGQITRDEEEQVVAYFGSGYLYATPTRQEPLM